MTLNVWHYETQTGPAKSVDDLTAQFRAKYPNVTVNVSVKAFSDALTLENLIASAPDAPDVIEGIAGPQVDGTLAKAGLIIPMGKYADAYGWAKTMPGYALSYNSFSADGKVYGEGELFGMPQRGETVGIYYNKTKVAALGYQAMPSSIGDLEGLMDKARAAGETPIELGGGDGWPAAHLLEQSVGLGFPAQQLRDWYFVRPGATIDTAAGVAGAQRLVDWVQKGYFNNDFLALPFEDAQNKFTKGEGVLFPTGTWAAGALSEGMKDNVGYAPFPKGASGKYVSEGATAGAFHISSKSKEPDLAAAYINFLTASPEAIASTLATGGLPVVAFDATQLDPLVADEVAVLQALVADDALIFYLGVSTPTMYDTEVSGVESLLGGKMSPKDYLKSLQDDWAAYQSAQKS